MARPNIADEAQKFELWPNSAEPGTGMLDGGLADPGLRCFCLDSISEEGG